MGEILSLKLAGRRSFSGSVTFSELVEHVTEGARPPLNWRGTTVEREGGRLAAR